MLGSSKIHSSFESFDLSVSSGRYAFRPQHPDITYISVESWPPLEVAEGEVLARSEPHLRASSEVSSSFPFHNSHFMDNEV